MKLWIDDERQPPDDTWRWVTNSADAITTLQDACVAVVSFDHDLGGDDTTRPVVTWMCMEEVWPRLIYVHSQNPIGVTWLMGTCSRYAPPHVVVCRKTSAEW